MRFFVEDCSGSGMVLPFVCRFPLFDRGELSLIWKSEKKSVTFVPHYSNCYMRNGAVDYQEDVLLSEEVAVERNLVLFNDEVNTFDFVIESLIDVCGHEPMQAEQCTLLVHYHGKCTVKSGDYDELLPLCTALHDRGLSAEVK